MSGYFLPLSALNANQTALSSVGNNLANLNTTGYKASTASFHDMVSQQLGASTSGSQVGMGVSTPIVRHNFIQGTVQGTQGLFDAAIQGDGFFVVKDAQGNQSYTRAGNFRVDGSGNLVTATGQNVQGWNMANGVLNPSGAVSNITMPSGALKIPIQTTTMSMEANLDATAATGATFSTPIQIVDSLGANHTLTVTYTKTGANAWSYDVTIPGEDVTGGTAGTPQSVANGALTFDTAGKLLTPAAPVPPAAQTPIAIPLATLANGAANQTINWNLYNPSTLAGTLTQFTQASGTSTTSQDGFTAAQPTKISLGDNGVIVAQFSNGKSISVAQIALASIRNPDTMVGIGDNNYQPGTETLTPTIGAANTGGRGVIRGSALESSTVDIAKEFTDLMIFQRSYQANSKVITTIDEISQETINLKR